MTAFRLWLPSGMSLSRLRSTAASVPANIVTTFGALTLAGAGGIAVAGTSIASGDPSGHWAISGGFIAPSAAGDTANLSAGSYSLVLDNGQTVSIFVESNCWDVRTTAEWDTVIVQSAATLSGKKIAIRPGQTITTGVDGTAARLRRNDYGGLEICCRPVGVLADVDKFTLRGARGVTLRRLRTDQTAATKILMIGEVANNLENIVIDDCHVRGAPGDPNGDYSISTNFPMNGIDLITTQGSAMLSVGNITVTNNLVEWCGTGIGVRVDKAGAEYVVGGNIVRYFYDDAIGLSMATGGAVPRPAAVTDNLLYANIGRSTDSANPHTDAIRFIGQIDATGDWPVVIDRNIIFVGNSRGDGHLQGVLASDFKTVSGDSGMFFTGQAIGNVIISDTTQALSIENAKDFFAANNTVVGSKTSGGLYTVRISIGAGSTYSTTSGTHVLERNIAEAYDVGGTPTLTDNLTVGKGGATISFASLFDGPSWYPNSRAEALSWFARKVGGPADIGGTYDIGAVGSGAVVFATTSPGSDGSNNVTAPPTNITLRRDLYDISMTGSSTTEGGHQTAGYGSDDALLAAFPLGTKSIFNRGAGGALIAASWTTQIPAMSTQEKAGSIFLQCDMNDIFTGTGSGPSEFGKGIVHAAAFKTNVVDAGLLAGHASKRTMFWMGTEYGWANALRYLRNRIFQEAMWTRYPGQAINAQDYWTQAPPADAQDSTDLSNVEIPSSYQIADRSHLNDKGYEQRGETWMLAHAQAQEGGLPFFAFYNYRGNLSTARTNGGDVCQLYYTGSLTGCTFSVRNRDGTVNADFGVRVSGSDIFLTRTSAAAITKGWNELFIRSVKANLTRDDWISVSVGSLGAAPGMFSLDGNIRAAVDSNDNRGTFDAPDFPSGNRVWPISVVPATGVTELSMVFDLDCNNSAFDALQMDLLNIGVSGAVRRLTTGAFRISLRDDANVALGQITGNTTAGQGRMIAADGRRIVFYSVKCSATAFQQLVICDLAGNVLQTVTTPSPAGSTVQVNPAAATTAWNELVTGAGGTNPFAGKLGTRWMATVAMDFTNAANRALFLSGGAMVNLPTSGAVTVAAGVNNGVVATPFRYCRGHAGDFWQGRNYGTGGDVFAFGRYRGTISGQPNLANPIGDAA